ncbi:hypothetical protein D3C78_1130090 [compost metagenome]
MQLSAGQRTQQLFTQRTFVQQGAHQAQALTGFDGPAQAQQRLIMMLEVFQYPRRQQVDEHAQAPAVEALGKVLDPVQRLQRRM